jgi:hypothetical protein
MQRVCFAEPTGGHVGDVQDTQPRSIARDTIEDRAGLVGRAVIDSDELDVRVILRENGWQSLLDFAGFVARGNDHRNFRRRTACKWRKISEPGQGTVPNGKLDGGQPTPAAVFATASQNRNKDMRCMVPQKVDLIFPVGTNPRRRSPSSSRPRWRQAEQADTRPGPTALVAHANDFPIEENSFSVECYS